MPTSGKNESVNYALMAGSIKRMMTAIVMLSMSLVVAACASGPSKSDLDDEVRRLCAIDGGIKVYETVALPANQFDSSGNVRIPFKRYAKPDDNFFIEAETVLLWTGNPQLDRMHSRVIRRSDGKVLGESIRYGRGGGDIPGPWHDSSLICPDPKIPPYLEQSIFLKDDRK
jgi:hypothetical protein